MAFKRFYLIAAGARLVATGLIGAFVPTGAAAEVSFKGKTI